MLAMADEAGIVRAAVPGLSRRAGVTLPECRKALAVLSEPDTESRSPENEGRRIQATDGGWLLLNYEKYREIRTNEQVLAARRMRKYREKQRNSDASSVTSSVTETLPPVADTSRLREAEAKATAKAEARDEKLPPSAGAQRRPTWLTPYAVLWRRHKGGKMPFEIAAKALRPLHEDYGEPEVLARMERYLQSTEGNFVSLPKFASTWGDWNGKSVSRTVTRQERNEAAIDRLGD